MKKLLFLIIIFIGFQCSSQNQKGIESYLNDLYLNLSGIPTKSEMLNSIQSNNNFYDVAVGIGEDGGIITLSINYHPLFENLQENHALLIFFDEKESINKILLVIRGNHFDKITSVFTNYYLLEKYDMGDETNYSFGFTLDDVNIFLKIDRMKIEIPKELIETDIIFPEDTFVSFYPKALN